MTTSIDIVELNNRLKGSEPITLLDVRGKADADSDPRCIAGAVYRNPEKMEAWIKELPVGSRAVVYCVKGGSGRQSVTERLLNGTSLGMTIIFCRRMKLRKGFSVSQKIEP